MKTALNVILGLMLSTASLAFAAKGENKNTKKALIVVSGHSQLGDTKKSTGWYLSEVTHIYYPLIEAGFKVDFASPKGGKAPMDSSSLKLEDPLNKKFVDDKALSAQMDKTLSLAKVQGQDYQVIHFAGGHGAMWDFPGNKDVSRVAASIYENGGIVSAVCHGPAALVDIKLSNGEYLVKGKDVSAFTDAEEKEVGLDKTVPFALETKLRERGANMKPAANWSDQSVTSERLVTGQNPQSGHSVAKRIIEAVKGLK